MRCGVIVTGRCGRGHLVEEDDGLWPARWGECDRALTLRIATRAGRVGILLRLPARVTCRQFVELLGEIGRLERLQLRGVDGDDGVAPAGFGHRLNVRSCVDIVLHSPASIAALRRR